MKRTLRLKVVHTISALAISQPNRKPIFEGAVIRNDWSGNTVAQTVVFRCGHDHRLARAARSCVERAFK